MGEEPIRGFADLEVYQKAYGLALRVYKVNQDMPEVERYGLVSQMRRASVSIPTNIAEGYGRQSSPAEFKNFLRMALGSANEMVVLLSLAKDLGYMNQGKVQELIQAYDSLGKQIYRLMQVWK